MLQSDPPRFPAIFVNEEIAEKSRGCFGKSKECHVDMADSLDSSKNDFRSTGHASGEEVIPCQLRDVCVCG